MSQEHDPKSTENVSVSDGVHSEASPFEPGYQPEDLPKISVPDLAEDAVGLSAESLAQIPTLTELVDAATEDTETVTDAEGEPELPVTATEAPTEQDASETPQMPEVLTPQAAPAQADTWVEELHARMGKLNGDITTLNARLDRLEERNKNKA